MARSTPSKTKDAGACLHIGGTFHDRLNKLILPWARQWCSTSGITPGRAAIVTPSPTHSAFLRGQLLSHNISLLGVRFFSPAPLRTFLLRQTGLRLTPRENNRLFLGIAAEKASNSPDQWNDEARAVSKAVARDPDHFLRVIEQILGAGCTFDHGDQPVLQFLARTFADLNHACGFVLASEADKAITVPAPDGQIFQSLLLFGFNGAHWPWWTVLLAAANCSEEVRILLSQPREEGRDLDEVWIGTWEEKFGPAQPVAKTDAEKPDTALDRLAWSLETGERGASLKSPNDSVHFIVGADSMQQARAVVALAAQFLRDADCQRLAILFHGRGALHRLAGSYLEAAGIPFHDAVGHLTPSAFCTAGWNAWIELQEKPTLMSFLRFARAVEESDSFFDKLPLSKAENILRRAYNEVLIDDLAILCARVRTHIASPDDEAVAAALESIDFLPPNGTMAEFLATTRKALSRMKWPDHWSHLERLTRGWSEKLRQGFSRRTFLNWLRQTLGRPILAREPFGQHPYSRVHLLNYGDAEDQTWTHLIFAGLNEETWPTLEDESGFIREQQISELNRAQFVRNRNSTRQGSQGEGQRVVRADRALLLGPNEYRQISLRRLLNLVESTSVAVGASANLYSETNPSRMANPSEFFSRLYFAARGKGVSQETMRALHAATETWIGGWTPVDAQKLDSLSVARSRYAYDARRQLRPAGEYEFSLRNPPTRSLSLRVTQWEQALRWPALVWLKLFLDVEAEDNSPDAWALATGQWVHQWLAESVQGSNDSDFVPISEAEEIRTRILERARRFAADTRDLCAGVNRFLPDWWTSGWSNALYIADCLAAKLESLSDWDFVATEKSLGAPAEVPLGDGSTLRLRGRIDLMLARGEPTQATLRFPDLWVVDYKTGRQRGFNLRELRKSESSERKYRKQLVEGRGVQLGLYALTVHALGARDVRLSLLSPREELEEKFKLSDVLAQNEFWQELARMQETGIFGSLGPLHSEFGFTRAYPLATLGVDPDLLQEKWEMTHPAFALKEGGEQS